MNRAEFFTHIYKKFKRWVKAFLLFCALTTIILRIINTELALKLAFYILLLSSPIIVLLVYKIHMCAIELYNYEHGKTSKDTQPSLNSVELFPQSAIVIIGVFAPSILVATVLFGLGENKAEHTALLNYLLVVQIAAAWFLWVFQPSVKKLRNSKK